MIGARHHHHHHHHFHDAGRCSNCYRIFRKDARRSIDWRAFLLSVSLDLDFAKTDGLITAVIQDDASGRVLMVGFMNQEAFDKTVETGFATFYSRSRNKLWLKGETSGHRLVVKRSPPIATTTRCSSKSKPSDPASATTATNAASTARRIDGNWVEVEPRTYDPAAVYGSKH